jgi:hypothetical protein
LTDFGIYNPIKATLKQVEAKMEKKRYQETDEQTFFGEYLYDRVVSEDHFLCKLKALLD